MNKNYPTIALGTWSWGKGMAGGDQVFGNNVGVEELRPVFDEAMKNGLNLWDSAVVYGMGDSESILSSFTKECKRDAHHRREVRCISRTSRLGVGHRQRLHADYRSDKSVAGAGCGEGFANYSYGRRNQPNGGSGGKDRS